MGWTATALRGHWTGFGPLKLGILFMMVAFLAFSVARRGGPGLLYLGPTYDGWRGGALETCPPYPTLPSPPSTELSTSGCELNLAAWLGVGRDGLDRRNPNHPPIVRATLHELDTKTFHSARCCEVAVFEMADGTVKAIGVNLVAFPVKQADGTLRISYANKAIDYGPDR